MRAVHRPWGMAHIVPRKHAGPRPRTRQVPSFGVVARQDKRRGQNEITPGKTKTTERRNETHKTPTGIPKVAPYRKPVRPVP